MTWTKTPPTESGYYWVRHKGGGIDIAELYLKMRTPTWSFCGCDTLYEPLEMVGGEKEFWSAPIQQPVEKSPLSGVTTLTMDQ